jgi:hypothetical protein
LANREGVAKAYRRAHLKEGGVLAEVTVLEQILAEEVRARGGALKQQVDLPLGSLQQQLVVKVEEFVLVVGGFEWVRAKPVVVNCFVVVLRN